MTSGPCPECAPLWCEQVRKKLRNISLTLLHPQFVLEFGGKGDEPGKFHAPIGIAINARDELFIAEFHTHRVQKFRP